jgi:hypothetical protein
MTYMNDALTNSTSTRPLPKPFSPRLRRLSKPEENANVND